MKKLNSETKTILLFSFIGIFMISSFTYSVITEQNFFKSNFSKKVEKVDSFKMNSFPIINMDCIYYTDGASTLFETYSIIDQNDTLVNVRVIDFIDVGDSVVKYKNEAFIRVVKKENKK